MVKNTMLNLYENVAEITDKMLAAAKANDWERLTTLEANCSALIQSLRTYDTLEPLTANELNQKIAAIKKILADDREIRNLVEPWMARLSTMLNSNRAGSKLARTYGQRFDA